MAIPSALGTLKQLETIFMQSNTNRQFIMNCGKHDDPFINQIPHFELEMFAYLLDEKFDKEGY